MYTIVEYSCIPGSTTIYVAHHGIFHAREDAMAQLDEWAAELTLYDCLASNETLYRTGDAIAIRNAASGTLHHELWLIPIF
jgi:effector-binding domain-containing protein